MGAEPEGCYDAPPTASMKRNFSGQVCRPEGVSRGPPCGYHAGQRVDVLDTVKKWAEAEVVRVDDAARRLLVTYTYWSDKWDEWLPAESPRIAPFGSRTYQRGGAPTPGQRVEALDETGAWLEAEVYGDDVHHDVVRRKCMDYMDAEQAFFEPYVEGDASAFRRYVAAKRRDGAWGDEPEVQALCELYDRPAEIWSYDAAANAKAGGAKVLRTFHGGEQASAGGAMAVGDVRRAPMRLSYYGGGHYDSVVRDAEPPAALLRAAGPARGRGDPPPREAADPAAARGAEAASDLEATDAARVAAALELSRGEFEAHDDDLEATLRASLDAAQDPEAERGVLQAQLDDAAVARAEEEELARALALSQEPWAADAERRRRRGLARGQRGRRGAVGRRGPRGHRPPRATRARTRSSPPPSPPPWNRALHENPLPVVIAGAHVGSCDRSDRGRARGMPGAGGGRPGP
ncbi:thiol-dependent ubiquitin-specific protease [Aureococcus anophagefferens]|nr:thiol-dependent ubiquitin-specific protease [Aureococcus anophagefferens]